MTCSGKIPLIDGDLWASPWGCRNWDTTVVTESMHACNRLWGLWANYAEAEFTVVCNTSISALF